ncbi:MAG: primosomal protein N' [Bacteroidota bacterium]
MPQDQLHPVRTAASYYVDVILPLAIARAYTYWVPEAFVPQVTPGVRVEVQFGKSKRYTGLVMRVHQEAPDQQKPKAIIGVIDELPIVTPHQFKLWKWISSYYICSLGEVMNAALPANFKLTSETRITLGPLFHQDPDLLDSKEYLVAEALSIQQELSIEDLQGILGQKTVYPTVRRLLEKRIIYLKENLKEKYRPKKIKCVRFREHFADEPENLHLAFDLVSRSTKQERTLLAYIQLSKKQEFVRQTELIKLADTDHGTIKAMAKKEIFEVYEREISRLGSYEEETIEAHDLADQQKVALSAIREQFAEKSVVLLHGVTGSGKTRVYLELLQEVIAKGGQVLYLLPEIALTAQITERVQKVLGDDIAVYHSRLNHNERIELWNKVKGGQSAVLGPRSALFLPFTDLQLIIVDEEHDPSYKQREPNPRYHGRDTAIMLAHQFGAKVLLGTATPAVETYQNTQTGKYGLVKIEERYGGIAMPEIVVADARHEQIEQTLHNHFTSKLLDELKAALERGEQAILFQNRRGYSPTQRCPTCGWHSECVNCDVSLTYHKFLETLKCHYCGYSTKPPTECPACGNTNLTLQGFGTEKIEDELKIFLPDAKIGRMDFDTVKGKNAHARIINDFEEGKIDILVGTQMVTKGLDFERVGVVGILSADQLLQFPDFRAAERGFQLMLQVAGRAGRKHRQGKVVIQAFNTAHPVIDEVLASDYAAFYRREIQERMQFSYPPYLRLIRITLKHKKPQTVNDAMRLYAHWLKQQLGEWVLGPAVPYVGRVRNYYLVDLLIKIERNPQKIAFAKKHIRTATNQIHQTQGYSNVRVSIDVDPY